MNNTQPLTLGAQLKQKITMPFWAWLLMYLGLACIGYAGGLMNPHSTFWDKAAVLLVGGLSIAAIPGVSAYRTHQAKRKLSTDTAAVSPVIGVILMVAITVVLAAIVFILVSHLSQSGPGELPQISLTSDSVGTTTATFTVSGIQNAPTWGELVFKDGTGATRTFTVNGAAPVTTARVAAGDVLKFTGLTSNTSYDFRAIYGSNIVWSGHAQTVA